MKTKILITLAAVLLMSACGFNDAHLMEIHELGYMVEEGSDVIPAEGGSLRLRIYSNGLVSISPKGTMPQWAQIDCVSLSGDATVTVTMDPNPGFERSVEFVALLDGGVKEMTFSVRQHGCAYIFCENPYASVRGAVAGEVSYAIDSNLPVEDLVVKVAYVLGTEGWITSTGFDGDVLKVSTEVSDATTPRKAILSVNLKDTADSCAVNLYLTQSSSSDEMGTVVPFAELRSAATAQGAVMGQFTLLQGVVVSDYRSANMEQNPVLSLEEAGEMTNTKVSNGTRSNVQQVVDTTATLRTAYVQSPDGMYGFKLVFDEPKDNVLAFGSAVTIDLEGASVIREENPERYTIRGLAGRNVLESASGTVVDKVRKISELTDADINTFVSLQNVEFPVKEGSYTDVRDNNALYSEVNANTTTNTGQHYFFMDGYATTLVDDQGCVICCPVNMLCRWRRPSEGIPQGSGTAKGIITFNEITRYGDAGRYQFRVVDETGFEGLKGGASNWNTLACWDKGSLTASAGSVALACELPRATIADEHSYKSINSATSRTDGISDTYRSIRVNSSIKDWYNWDGTRITGYNGMLFSFSPEDISGESLLFTFRFYAGRVGTGSTYVAFPSHWCVEYSVDGQTWKLAQNGDLSGNDYVHLRAISTMHFVMNGYTYRPSTHYALGPTGHSFIIPGNEVFGKEGVMIRLRPYDNVMSSLYPMTFRDDLEHAVVTSATEATNYVSFQDIILSYR